MSIAITEDHRALADTASELLQKRDARGAARALLESPTEELPALWNELTDLGWLGLHIPEEHGGSGYGLEELVVVVEELGRAVAPGPVRADRHRQRRDRRRGDDATKAALLPGLADGSVTAGVALDGSVTVDAATPPRASACVLGGGLASVLLAAGGRRRRRRRGRRRRHRRDAHQPRPDAPLGAGHARRRDRDGAPRRSASARRPRPRDPRRRGRRRRARVHGDGGGLREGAAPVRPPDRHVPGGEAPLRQHGRRHRAGHVRGVGRRQGRRDRRRPAHATPPRSPPRSPRRRPTCAPTSTPRCTAASPSRGSTTPTSSCGAPRRCCTSSTPTRAAADLVDLARRGVARAEGDRAAARGRGDPRGGAGLRREHQGPARRRAARQADRDRLRHAALAQALRPRGRRRSSSS